MLEVDPLEGLDQLELLCELTELTLDSLELETLE